MTMQVAVHQPAQDGRVIAAMIDSTRLADRTKAQYKKAVHNYLEAGHDLRDARTLATYAQGVSNSTRTYLKSALKIWSEQVLLEAKSQATPDNIAAIQATEARFEALNKSIEVEPPKGEKSHSWLSQAEVKKMLESCNKATPAGRRDYIVLGLMVGAGLRREELVNLTFDDIKLQPVANKFRTVLDIKGKGNKNRVVPIHDKLAAALDDWRALVGAGKVARSVTRGGKIGESISPIGIFKIVSSVEARRLAKENKRLAPHDLRRTFAQLGFEAGVPVTQISKLLGHANIATTQRYLNLELDLKTTVSDFIPF